MPAHSSSTPARSQYIHSVKPSRLSAEIAALPIAVFLWEVVGDDFVLTDFNEAAMEMTHGGVESLVGCTAVDLYEHDLEIVEIMRRVCGTGAPERSEMDYRMRTTGEDRILSAAFIRHAPGQLLVVTEDLTQRRAAELALRDSELRYRTLVEGAPDGIVVHRGGRILFVNDAFVEMLRLPSRHSIIGTPVLDLVHPEDREHVRRRVAAISSGENAPLAEERLMRADGTVVHAEIAGIPTTFDGQPAVQAVVRDISERRRAEALFHAVSAQSLTGIAVIQEGRFIYANRRCAELFGCAVHELIGLPTDLLIAEKSRELVRHMHRRRIEDGHDTVQYTFTARRSDGSEVDLDLFGSIVDLEGRKALVATLLDATERENMGAQLRQAQKMEAIGQLAGGVAHDFNNILTAIGAYSELLLQQLDQHSQLRRDVLEIRSAGQRGAELTRQLLALSRRQALQPQLLDVNAVLEGMSHMLRRLIDERITLTLELSADVAPVLADRGQLEQVMLNLCVNARDAMPDGGHLTLGTGRSHFDATGAAGHPGLQPGHYTHVRVTDSGNGMPPAVAARIFEPFFTTKPAGQGTGLGLAVVYGIVKQSGGYIMLATAPGTGSTFTVLLPAIQNR
jgi:two-component system, cell cycle sensor histidine kinase and response regulator CckA